MRMTIIVAAVYLALASAVSAATGIAGPVDIPGGSYCTECGMMVRSDNLFASELILSDGKAVFFCDLGDMMLHYEKKGAKKVAAVYVKDYTSGKWTDGRKAYYLTGAKVRTPMRYGIVAFADRKAALEFRKSPGGDEILTFDEAMSKGVYK